MVGSSSDSSTGDRKPTAYLERMDAIRELDDYIVEQCHRHHVPVITSTTFEAIVMAVTDVVSRDLEARFDTHPRPGPVGRAFGGAPKLARTDPLALGVWGNWQPN